MQPPVFRYALRVPSNLALADDVIVLPQSPPWDVREHPVRRTSVQRTGPVHDLPREQLQVGHRGGVHDQGDELRVPIDDHGAAAGEALDDPHAVVPSRSHVHELVRLARDAEHHRPIRGAVVEQAPVTRAGASEELLLEPELAQNAQARCAHHPHEVRGLRRGHLTTQRAPSALIAWAEIFFCQQKLNSYYAVYYAACTMQPAT